MMKKLLLATVATVALTASGALAAEQGARGHAGAGGEMKAGAPAKTETFGAGTSTENKAGGDTKSGVQMRSESKSSDSKSGAQMKSESKSAGTHETTGVAPSSGSVNLTTEQRTKIRTTVIGKAPKVSRTDINFSINVGTVVPRSVHVVAVPPALVEIHPAWRGYRYFVVGDEIVIVEPRTLKIVYVLPV